MLHLSDSFERCYATRALVTELKEHSEVQDVLVWVEVCKRRDHAFVYEQLGKQLNVQLEVLGSWFARRRPQGA